MEPSEKRITLLELSPCFGNVALGASSARAMDTSIHVSCPASGFTHKQDGKDWTMRGINDGKSHGKSHIPIVFTGSLQTLTGGTRTPGAVLKTSMEPTEGSKKLCYAVTIN